MKLRPPIEVRDRRTWAGNQTLCGSLIVRTTGAPRDLFRATIVRDAYDPQSTACVTVWCVGRGWRLVQEVPITNLPIGAFSYVQPRREWESAMDDSLRLLCDLGRSILSTLPAEDDDR